MNIRHPSTEQFLRDVSNHKMEVRLDQGSTEIYRHLRFAQPKNSNMWFDIVTWPGNLTIRGDMGTWTFSRVPDMFTFFRDDKLRINLSYWAEKIQNGVNGGRDNAKRFDGDLFAEQILAHLSERYGFEGADLEEITQAVKDEVLSRDNKWEVLLAARDFSHRFSDDRKFYFDPCELPDGKDYAYHFVWCCYAIVWGIQQYDASIEKGESNGR